MRDALLLLLVRCGVGQLELELEIEVRNVAMGKFCRDSAAGCPQNHLL